MVGETTSGWLATYIRGCRSFEPPLRQTKSDGPLFLPFFYDTWYCMGMVWNGMVYGMVHSIMQAEQTGRHQSQLPEEVEKSRENNKDQRRKIDPTLRDKKCRIGCYTSMVSWALYCRVFCLPDPLLSMSKPLVRLLRKPCLYIVATNMLSRLLKRA